MPAQSKAALQEVHMRVQAGQAAKLFTTTDISGKVIELEAFRGRRTMLSFYRYASCPFCN